MPEFTVCNESMVFEITQLPLMNERILSTAGLTAAAWQQWLVINSSYFTVLNGIHVKLAVQPTDVEGRQSSVGGKTGTTLKAKLFLPVQLCVIVTTSLI